MKFDWSRFAREDYENMINGKSDYNGSVHIGDICIELVVFFYPAEKLFIRYSRAEECCQSSRFRRIKEI